MGLTQHIDNKTIVGDFLLDIVNPLPLPRSALIDPLIVHQGKRWSHIGVAFDYLVRMSIASDLGFKRFDPEIASHSMELFLDIYHCKSNSFYFRNGDFIGRLCDCETCFHIKKFKMCIEQVDKAIVRKDVYRMIYYSIKLARLDLLFRDGKFDKNWHHKDIDKNDAKELQQLHDLWKESFTLPRGKVLFNPYLKKSPLIGGADADLIVGKQIIDWKVVNSPKKNLEKNLAQIAGYSLLSIFEKKPIYNCTLYFARHGVPFTSSLKKLLNIPVLDAAHEFIDVIAEHHGIVISN